MLISRDMTFYSCRDFGIAVAKKGSPRECPQCENGSFYFNVGFVGE